MDQQSDINECSYYSLDELSCNRRRELLDKLAPSVGDNFAIIACRSCYIHKILIKFHVLTHCNHENKLSASYTPSDVTHLSCNIV